MRLSLAKINSSFDQLCKFIAEGVFMKLINLLAGFGLFLTVQSSFADDEPLYENGVLTIPSVDSVSGAGSLQDVVIQFTDQGELRLVSFRESIAMRQLSGVELVQTETFPVQVFLKVSGGLSSGCSRVGQVRRKTVGNRIDVIVYFANDEAFFNPEILCPAVFTYFTEVVELPVYGLAEGEYEYSVNGEFSGSFSLAKDNSL